MIRTEKRIYDVVVVGAAAAGLSAALVLGRARRRVAVVDAGAPRNAPAAHMQGFLSRPEHDRDVRLYRDMTIGNWSTMTKPFQLMDAARPA